MGPPAQPQINGDLTSRTIRNQHRDCQWIDPRWPSGAELLVLDVHGPESANAGSHHDSHPLLINTGALVCGHRPGLASGHHSQLSAAVGTSAEQRLQV